MTKLAAALQRITRNTQYSPTPNEEVEEAPAVTTRGKFKVDQRQLERVIHKKRAAMVGPIG
jgi:hypothetical protein